MYEIGGKKYFETVTEAKLAFISQIRASSISAAEQERLIELIKISVEQHGTKASLITMLEENIPVHQRTCIQADLDALKRSPTSLASSLVINNHATIGAVESFLPAQLLTNPTTKMQEARDNISCVLKKTLEGYLERDFKSPEDKHGKFRDSSADFKIFASRMIFECEYTYPGTFSLDEINSHLPAELQISKDKIRNLTQEQAKRIIELTIERLNSPATKNIEIMAIHTQFGYNLLKRVVLATDETACPEEHPVYARIVEEYNKKNGTAITADQFMEVLRNPDVASDAARAFISDDMMYKSPLYQLERTRGRGNPDQRNGTTSLGIIRSKEPGIKGGLPQLKGSPWVDWSQCPFEPDSKIVQSMTSTETPFISSYSGTTSLLLNLALSANPASHEEHLSYLCSAMGYISGAGYHSIHEILGPAAHCLDLLPRDCYPVEVASSPDKYLPPQYHSFYQKIASFDPELMERRSVAWSQLESWYQTSYAWYHPVRSEIELIESICIMANKDPVDTATINYLKTLSHMDEIANLVTEPFDAKKYADIRAKYQMHDASIRRVGQLIKNPLDFPKTLLELDMFVLNQLLKKTSSPDLSTWIQTMAPGGPVYKRPILCSSLLALEQNRVIQEKIIDELKRIFVTRSDHILKTWTDAIDTQSNLFNQAIMQGNTTLMKHYFTDKDRVSLARSMPTYLWYASQNPSSLKVVIKFFSKDPAFPDALKKIGIMENYTPMHAAIANEETFRMLLKTIPKDRLMEFLSTQSRNAPQVSVLQMACQNPPVLQMIWDKLEPIEQKNYLVVLGEKELIQNWNALTKEQRNHYLGSLTPMELKAFLITLPTKEQNEMLNHWDKSTPTVFCMLSKDPLAMDGFLETIPLEQHTLIRKKTEIDLLLNQLWKLRITDQDKRLEKYILTKHQEVSAIDDVEALEIIRADIETTKIGLSLKPLTMLRLTINGLAGGGIPSFKVESVELETRLLNTPLEERNTVAIEIQQEMARAQYNAVTGLKSVKSQLQAGRQKYLAPEISPDSPKKN